jgi:hypothetical protein
MGEDTLSINRAPVLTLWAVVVAEHLGHDRNTALSLGKAVAGLAAQAKGRLLGIYGPSKDPDKRGTAKKAGLGEELWVELCGRNVPAVRTAEGIRAVKGAEPIAPEPVERYLHKSFGEGYDAARNAMGALAASMDEAELARDAYELYVRFRPSVPAGKAGWGARGELDLQLLRSLGRRR